MPHGEPLSDAFLPETTVAAGPVGALPPGADEQALQPQPAFTDYVPPVLPAQPASPAAYAAPMTAPAAGPQRVAPGVAPGTVPSVNAAAPATANGTPNPLAGAFSQITSADMQAAARPAAQVLGPLLAALTVLSAIVSELVLDEGHEGGLADWLRTSIAAVAASVGGTLGVSGFFTGDEAAGSLSTTGRALPLLVTTALLGLTVWTSAKAERSTPSADARQLATRAVLTGAVFAVALGLFTVLAKTSTVYGYGLADELDVDGAKLEAGAGLVSSFLGALVLVSIAAYVGRLRATSTAAVPVPLPVVLAKRVGDSRVAGARPAAALLGAFTVACAVTVAVLGVLYLAYQALLTDSLDGERLQAFATLLIISVNAVGYGLLSALGIPVAYSAAGGGSGSVFGFGDSSSGAEAGSLSIFDSKRLMLALLIPVLVALAVTIRRTLRQSDLTQLGRDGKTIKAAAVLGAGGAFTLALLLRVSGTGEASGSIGIGSLGGQAEAAAGPSLLWAPIVGALWGAGLVLALRFAPTLALSLPTAVVRRLGGGKISPEWAAALNGTGPAPAGTRSQAVRAGAAVAAAALSLAALGGIALVAVNALFNTPKAAVANYFQALEDGDVSAAMDMLAAAPEIDGQPLLEDQVLDSEDVTLLNDVEISKVEAEGDYATAEVTYKIDGQSVTEQVTVTADGQDKRFGVLRTWKVGASLPVLPVYQTGPLSLTVAGVGLSEGEYLALPGSYVVKPSENALLTASPVTVRLSSQEFASPVEIVPSIKPEVRDQARTAIEERLADCAAQTTYPLVNCPFGGRFFFIPDDLQGLKYSVVQEPTWSLQYDAFDGGISIVTDDLGEVAVTGTRTFESFFSGPVTEPYEDVSSFNLDGRLGMSGGSVSITFEE